MNKKPFRFAAICIAVCSCLVLVLYVFADKPNELNNGFQRVLPVKTAILKNTLALKYPAYYIAGMSGQQIYLGNYSASSHLLMVDKYTGDTEEIRFSIPSREKYAWKAARISVDSSSVFITEGNTPALFQGSLEQKTMKKILSKGIFFNSLEPISGNSFVVRSIFLDSAGKSRNILAKIRTDSPFVQLAKTVLTPQVDGIFCTDGTFHVDRQTKKIVYLYHYRNEFLTLDSNLNLLYTAKTLDTNSRAKITVARIVEGDSKFSAPPTYVNGRVRIADGKVYVLSSLRADNEETAVIQKNDIIDVFGIDKGKYLYSIYIPHDLDNRVSDFAVNGNQLLAIHDQRLNTYTIRTN